MMVNDNGVIYTAIRRDRRITTYNSAHLSL